MAKNKSTVYLGYDDEEITEKHASLLNSTLNKIGGAADWPNGEIKIPPCPLCGTTRPLLVQLYAPLDLSQFHRTLFIFACLNPACSPNAKSWLCVRTQHLEAPNYGDIISTVAASSALGGVKQKRKQLKPAKGGQISWCSGADDWGESGNISDVLEKMDTETDEAELQNEKNGNVVSMKMDNCTVRGGGDGCHLLLDSAAEDHVSEAEAEDDDEDESNSMDNELICGFGQLDMHSPQTVGEDPNANCASGVAASAAETEGSYACCGATATICAEIEGAETDVVLVETPRKPERDLIALLKHTPTPTAHGPLARLTDLTLKPYFIAVDVEQRQQEYECYVGSLSEDHIRELYQEYKKEDEAKQSPSNGGLGYVAVGPVGPVEEQELYEKSIPAHGDVIFYEFLNTIQQNPGQILRYSRDALPLLIAPLAEPVPKCPNCNGETICEVQILSTLIPKLRLQQNNEPVPIEYGNVLVFTCLKSCWDTPDKMRYERVVVQAEK